eukprot:754059-Hanusia_phi.AAC.5
MMDEGYQESSCMLQPSTWDVAVRYMPLNGSLRRLSEWKVSPSSVARCSILNTCVRLAHNIPGLTELTNSLFSDDTKAIESVAQVLQYCEAEKNLSQ